MTQKPDTTIKMLRWAGCCAVLAMAAHASAQMAYKCTSASGGIRYTDASCDRSDTASQVSIQPNQLGTADLRDSLLRREVERLKAQLLVAQQGAPSAVANANRNATAAASPVVVDDAPQARFDSVACTRARRDYEVTASSSANTRAIVSAKRSMMYGACGLREPDEARQTVVIQRHPYAPLHGGAYAILP